MKRFRSSVVALCSLAVAFCLASAANGQGVVSAKAGYIHFAQGGVLLGGEPFEFNPAVFVHAGPGQRLRTLDGRAEVMITPVSFVRLAPHSEIELIETGAFMADLRLVEGSTAVDLAGATDTEGITVEMGDARVRFLKSGLYRLDVPADRNPVVRVVHGKAKVELYGEKIDVRGGQQLTVAPSREKLRAKKIGKLKEDELDRWNAQRRNLLAAESRKQNREPKHERESLDISPPYHCRACGVAPGRDPKRSPRTRPGSYPLVRFKGVLP